MSFNETSLEQNSYRKQINSVYGAVNVGWKHLVYLDATLRGDQSSTLPIGNNVYVYPSFSGSFVFSELLKQSDLMPYGKFRLSWAQVGSDTDLISWDWFTANRNSPTRLYHRIHQQFDNA